MIRIGTCSWKYDSWKGIVYSEDAEKNYLAEYKEHFDTVEVDQWFWSLFEGYPPKLPDSNNVEEYNNSVGDNFRFTVKAPNSITLTHYYRKGNKGELKENSHFFSMELFEKFAGLLKPFGKKLGPVMLQFEYLNKMKMPSLRDFLAKFENFLDGIQQENFPLAIEIRNPNYLKEEYFTFLKDNALIPVFLQGYYMPPVFEVINKYYSFIGDSAVIRLHGPDRSDIEKKTGKKWDRIVLPKDDELEKLAQLAERFAADKIDLYINVNNHYEGSAPLTIEKIRGMIA